MTDTPPPPPAKPKRRKNSRGGRLKPLADKYAPKSGDPAGIEHKPTAKQRGEVSGMAQVGVPHHNIANMLRISTQTLLKHYKAELEVAATKGIYDVSKSLRTQCKKGNVKAQMFFLQTQANWRVTNITQQQTLGADGEPVAPPEAKDPVDAMRSYLDFLGK